MTLLLSKSVFCALLILFAASARLVTPPRSVCLSSKAEWLAQSPALEQLEQEVEALRVEREHVRQRVERLLSQLDALEL